MILLSSPKGGVGVSTLCAALADGLARRGHAVVAIDLSGQGTLALQLGAAPPDEAEERPAIPCREIDPAVPRGAERAAFALHEHGEGMIAIVDIAAGDGETAAALARHADLALCVLAADAGSLAVLPRLLPPGGPVPHCILNRTDDREGFARDAAAFLHAVLGPKLIATVRRDEAVNEALAGLTTIAADSAAARDIATLGDRVVALLAPPAAARAGRRDVA